MLSVLNFISYKYSENINSEHKVRSSLFSGQSHKAASLSPPLDVEVLLWLQERTGRDSSEILRMYTRFINLYPSGKILKQ